MAQQQPKDPYSAMSQGRVKHLEMIQAIVTRLGSNGFTIKGWAIAAVSLFLGFSVEDGDPALAFVALVPLAALYAVDTYFLRSERLFRELYARVANHDKSIAPFDLNATSHSFRATCDSGLVSYRRTLLRPVLWKFYSGLTLAIIALAILAGIRGVRVSEAEIEGGTEKSSQT